MADWRKCDGEAAVTHLQQATEQIIATAVQSAHKSSDSSIFKTPTPTPS
jgi:hypothetical protein